MTGNYRWMLLIALGFLALIFTIGCAENERREVKVIHEQQEGEVTQEQPGEMVVE